MKYQIKQISEDNLRKVSLFLNEIFKNDDFNENILYWKYYENPAGNALLLGAYDNDTLIGFRAVIPWKFNINNENKTLYQFVEASTSARYRGQHIFTNLTQEAINILKNQIFFNFPHEGNSYYAYKKSFDSKKIDEFHYLLIPFFNLFSKKHNIDNNKNIYFKIDNNQINIIDYNNFENFMNKMNKYSFSNKIIKPNRTFSFIKWRFIDNPKKRYHFIVISENNEDIGYIILGSKKIKNKNIPIVLELFNNIEAKINILKYLKLYSKYINCNFILYPILNHKIKEDILHYKCINIPKKKINLVITAKNYNNIDIYLNPKNWDINLTEVDTF